MLSGKDQMYSRAQKEMSLEFPKNFRSGRRSAFQKLFPPESIFHLQNVNMATLGGKHRITAALYLNLPNACQKEKEVWF